MRSNPPLTQVPMSNPLGLMGNPLDPQRSADVIATLDAMLYRGIITLDEYVARAIAEEVF